MRKTEREKQLERLRLWVAECIERRDMAEHDLDCADEELESAQTALFGMVAKGRKRKVRTAERSKP
jgi:hypothetical protein